MINKKKTPRLAASGSVLRRASIESMESRRLLSASPTFMAGRFWDFAPMQNPPIAFARSIPSQATNSFSASPDLVRPFVDSPIEADHLEVPWHGSASSDSFARQSDQFQGGDLTMNSDFTAMSWQGGPALIIDVPTALSQFAGTDEVVYSISISGPFFSTGSIQGATVLVATSFRTNPVGMFGPAGFGPGGPYHDGRADRADMTDPDQYAPPSTPAVYSVPLGNVATSADAGNTATSATAHINLARADTHPQTQASSQASSAASAPAVVSSDRSLHGNTSPIPMVSAVTSTSTIASTAATVASVTPRLLVQESAAILQQADVVVRVVGGTLATTGASAATTIVPQMTDQTQSFATAAPIVVQETAALAQAVVHVNPIDAVATFSDALAAFARDCAGIGTAKVDAPGSHRAWAITGAVLAADAILIGQWYARRSRNQQESDEEQKTPATSAKRVQPMLAELPLVK